LEERDRLLWANRTLDAKKAELETEVYDTRTVAENYRAKLTAAETTMEDKDRLIEDLRLENDRLQKGADSAMGIMEKFAKVPVNPVVVMERRLPPELDSAVKAFAQQHPNMVAYDDKRGIVKWVADVLFVSGSDVVKETAAQSLRDFAAILKSPAAADFEIVVVGHTDDRPVKREATRAEHKSNWHLSAHRAIAVSDVLLQAGYEASRVSVTGCGEFRPLVPNSSEDNMAKNRRVDVYIVPRGTLVAVGPPGLNSDSASK